MSRETISVVFCNFAENDRNCLTAEIVTIVRFVSLDFQAVPQVSVPVPGPLVLAFLEAFLALLSSPLIAL